MKLSDVEKNIISENDLIFTDMNKRFKFTDKALKHLGLYVCSQCSGKNNKGQDVFRNFNSAYT